MDARSKALPPKSVGERVQFQVPETTQLFPGNYRYKGGFRTFCGPERGYVRFHVFRRLANFVVAQDLHVYAEDACMTVVDRAVVPLYVNPRLRVIRIGQLPSGTFRVAGVGSVKDYGDEPVPLKVYLLERVLLFRDFRYFAVQDPRFSLPDGTLIEIVRRGSTLSLRADYREVEGGHTLDEDFHFTEMAIYEWSSSGGFERINRFAPTPK